MSPNRLVIALSILACAAIPTMSSSGGNTRFDPLLDDGATCAPRAGGPPALLRQLLAAAGETAPFQPGPAQPVPVATPVLYKNLGTLSFKAGTGNPRAQAWFDQGMRLSFGFNHAEAQRAERPVTVMRSGMHTTLNVSSASGDRAGPWITRSLMAFKV